MGRAASDSENLKILSPTAVISPVIPPESVDLILHSLARIGTTAVLSDEYNAIDFYSDVIAGVLKQIKSEHGSVSYHLTAKPSILNWIKTLHGGAIAAIAEAASIACVRTVFPEDMGITLGELGISYLSGARENAEVNIEAKVIRKGRNVTVVGTEFRLKKTQQLIYLTRATFYNMPASKL